MLVLVLKGKSNLYNVVTNMPETTDRGIRIKMQKASYSQGWFKKQNPKQPGPCSELSRRGV